MVQVDGIKTMMFDLNMSKLNGLTGSILID